MHWLQRPDSRKPTDRRALIPSGGLLAEHSGHSGPRIWRWMEVTAASTASARLLSTWSRRRPCVGCRRRHATVTIGERAETSPHRPCCNPLRPWHASQSSPSGAAREWTLDGLFYQERVLELRGDDHEEASPALRRSDCRRPAPVMIQGTPATQRGLPTTSRSTSAGSRFRSRQPPSTHSRASGRCCTSRSRATSRRFSLFSASCRRFRPWVAAGVAAAAAFLPPLTQHSSFPITDSWGLRSRSSPWRRQS